MNTNALLTNLRHPALLMACAGLLAAGPALTAVETYDNSIDFSFGLNSVTDNKAAFQRHTQSVKDGFGGIESLYLTKDLNDTTSLVLKGRALAGENDYLFDLTINKEDIGYLKFGYKEYRVWYDGMGGYMPDRGYIARLYDEEMHVDRGNLWFEAGYTPVDRINFRIRYDYYTRQGNKDSTSWADSNLASSAGTRSILPSFLTLDEKRQVIVADLSQALSSQDWKLGLRYDKGDFTNSRNERRRAGESGFDRKVTQKEGQDYDLFQVHGMYVNRISEVFTLSTAVARTKIDTVLSGSRISGQVYDPVFDPLYQNRQYHDEGFYGLHGESEMKQTVATISGAYTPTKHLTIVPSLRFENADWTSMADFEETAVGSTKVLTVEEIESHSSKGLDTYTEGFEIRYKGIKDWNLNVTAELSQMDGDLAELETIEPGTPGATVGVDRATEFNRDTAKYAATANWYPKVGTTIAFQYYFKTSKNDYNTSRDSATTTGDRYPAYITKQDFETNDFNVRLSKRLASNLRTVTRYDYQESTINSQMAGLNSVESMDMTTHILAESLSWSPKPRWYLQGTVNFVWDTLRTPATTITGSAAGMMKNSDANYTNVTLGSGYAIDDASDLYVNYSFYTSNNSYVDNSARSVPFGADNRSQTIGATWTRTLSERVKLSIKYAFADYQDDTLGGNGDYSAHLIYTKLQYRF